MERVLNACEKVDKITRLSGRFGSMLLLPLILVIVYDVVSRKIQIIQQMVLNSWLYDFISPTKLQELEWHLHGAIFLFGFGACYLKNAHVRVDVLREGFSEKKQAVVELLGLALMGIPFMGILIFFGIDFVSTSYLQGEGSSALTGIPHRWIIKSTLLIGVIIFLASMLTTATRLLIFLGHNGTAKELARHQLTVLSGTNPKDLGKKQ